MSKVYIAQEPIYRDKDTGAVIPRFDLTPAAVYGELEFLTPGNANSLMPGPTMRALRQKLRGFSDEDFILPTGDPVLIAMVVLVAAESNMGKVKMLKWDKPTRSYIVIQLDTRS